MKITKDQKQAEIVNTWNKNNRIGLLTAVGSFGKSISAIKCALFIKEEKPVIHIIVPRQILKEQWEGILSTWKVENAEVFVVNSYIKTEMVCDFLIQDEIHMFSNEDALVFNQAVLNSKWKYFLGLTATISPQHIETLNKRGIKEICHISMKEALLNEWVAPVIEYNKMLDFTEAEFKSYADANKMYEFYFKTFYNKFDDVMACLNPITREGYLFRRNRGLLPNSPMYLDGQKATMHAVQFNRWLKKRKDILYNAYNKIQAVIDILAEHPNERTIIFSESTLFCDILHERLPNSVLYHSKVTDKKKKENLKKFLNKESQYLIGAKSVDQGFDDSSVTLGIITSSTSSSTQHRQRLYRVTRYEKDKLSYLYNLVIRNSQEESWTKTKQKETRAALII
jgi:superfamily II DNA or RNA helicase